MSAFFCKKKNTVKCHPGYWSCMVSWISKLSMITNKTLPVKIVCHSVASLTLQLAAVSPSSPLPATPPGMLAGEGIVNMEELPTQNCTTTRYVLSERHVILPTNESH